MSQRRRVSHSQLKLFKRCRQKWHYAYQLGLNPKQLIDKIELGRYGHALLEGYYKGESIEEVSQRYWDENTKDMFVEEEFEFEDIRDKAERLVRRYIAEYADENFEILGVEQEFEVYIKTPKGNKSFTRLYGILDMIAISDINEVWLFDHKFTSIDLDSYEDSLDLDAQANCYLWAMREMLREQGVNLPVAGIVFNLVRTKEPTVPRVLKSGELSRAKSIDTDRATYLQAIIDNDLNVEDYKDFLDHVEKAEKPFFKRHFIYRTPEEIDKIGEELYRNSIDIRQPNIYRNPTRDCRWDCRFKELCIMDLKGIDTSEYREEHFDKKEN